ncbi:hemolysin family protein [bacterium]|nr:hemolysin family protein [bacterium]
MLGILLAVGFVTIVSFLCSLWEAALYSIPQSRIEALREAGSSGARRLARLRENIDEPIAAILTLNTLAHTIGATVAGALVEGRFGAQYPFALTLFSISFSIHILIVTEIIPKTLGVVMAEKLAPLFAFPIQITIWMLWPLVKTSQGLTKILTARFGDKESGPTRADLHAMARLAAEAGHLRKDELIWSQNALLLHSVTAHDLMTPRIVVESFDAATTLGEVARNRTNWTKSRVPIWQDSPENIVGIVRRRDVFDEIIEHQDSDWEQRTLAEFKRDVTMIPENIDVYEVLRRFLETHNHLFIVIDEFGGMEGLITLEDVLEFFLGAEIMDAYDQHEDLQVYAKELAKKRQEGRRK